MNTIIIRKTGQIAAIACIALAMSACATSQPSPWSKPSPWSQKRAEDVAYSEPVSAEPYMAEPVAAIAVEPMPVEPIAVEPVAVESMSLEPVAVAMIEEPAAEMKSQAMTPEEEIMVAPSGNYTIQVLAAGTSARLDKFSAKHSLDDMSAIRTERGGKVWYVLIAGNYPSYSAAKADLGAVGDRVSTKPWVRKIKSLQKIVAPE